MKKEELFAFLKEVRRIKDEVPVRKKKHIGKIKMTRNEIKIKIRELKILKFKALEAGDGNKARRLIHQISQLKKKSRHFVTV